MNLVLCSDCPDYLAFDKVCSCPGYPGCEEFGCPYKDTLYDDVRFFEDE